MILVEPEHGGNVGSIARLMKNFGLSELWLVHPKIEIDEEVRAFASHAQEIVANISIVETLDEAVEETSYIVGSSSILATRSSNMIRTPVTPQEFAQISSLSEGKIALLFGRESTGLTKEELSQCDVLITIPSSPLYRTLNIASAAGIIFYELWKMKGKNQRAYVEEADKNHRERLLTLFTQICHITLLPPHKETLANKAFKNILSRAFISKRESTLLIGVFRDLLQRFKSENNSVVT